MRKLALIGSLLLTLGACGDSLSDSNSSPPPFPKLRNNNLVKTLDASVTGRYERTDLTFKIIENKQDVTTEYWAEADMDLTCSASLEASSSTRYRVDDNRLIVNSSNSSLQAQNPIDPENPLINTWIHESSERISSDVTAELIQELTFTEDFITNQVTCTFKI
jgi:hypothetical protein